MIFGSKIFDAFFEWLLEGPDPWKDVPVIWVQDGTTFEHHGPAPKTVIYQVIEGE